MTGDERAKLKATVVNHRKVKATILVEYLVYAPVRLFAREGTKSSQSITLRVIVGVQLVGSDLRGKFTRSCIPLL